MPRLTLTAEQKAQLGTWLDEPQGLRETIDLVMDGWDDPFNVAQRALYEWLLTNDGINVTPPQIVAFLAANPDVVPVLMEIVGSLDVAEADGRWNAGRAAQKGLFGAVRGHLGV